MIYRKVIFCLIVICGFGFYYYKFFRKIPDVDPEEDENGSYSYPSELLRKVYGACGLLLELDYRVTEMLENDPFQPLFDERVKPAYDNLASVKKQTEIYEGMARIQGGPTNFMTTAIKTVESIEFEVLETELEFRRIIGEMSDDLTNVKENWASMGEQINQINYDPSLWQLEDLGITMPDVDEELGPKPYEGNFTLEDIMPLLDVLITLHSRQENIRFEVFKAMVKEKGLNFENGQEIIIETEGDSDTLKSNLSRVEDYIENIVENYYDQLISTGPLIGGILLKLSDNINEIAIHHVKAMVKYEELIDILRNDLIRTKERISNLKEPAKVSDEL